MKVFENKGIFRKIAIVLVFVIICSFCFSGKVDAKSDLGGKLLSPVVDFVLFLGDGIMNVVHTVIFNQNDTTVTVDMTKDWFEIFTTILVGVVIAAVVAVVIVVSAGAVAAAAAAIGVSLSSIGVGTVLFVSLTTGAVGAAVFNSNVLPSDIQLPVYQISPDKIFSNEVLLFDVDFFNPKDDKEATDVNGDTLHDKNGDIVYLESTAKQLRTVISSWYVILRDISVVALLSVLVYIGIKILISSTSNDKAKYKQMLGDWIVAICLLFVMQYMMSFSNLFIGKITDVISNMKTDKGYVSLIEDKNGKIAEALKKENYCSDEQLEQMKVKIDGKDYINWKTDLLGVARLNAQMAKQSSASYAGYALIFVVLVLFTIYFVFTYLKRVLYMAFLTVIAPLVALTYPIDKINDGKAQAFDMWFKEYIFNLLIQPMHLVLYTILVSSAYELASTNIIYSLVALGFMIPAEKLLRKFFGFEKAQTPGLLAGPAGAALMMSGMNKLFGKGSKGAGKSLLKGSGKSADSADNGKPPRTNPNFDKDEVLFGEGNTDDKGDLSSDESGNNFDDINEDLGIKDDKNKFSSPYSNNELDEMKDYLGIEDSSINTNSGVQNNSNDKNNNYEDSNLNILKGSNGESNSQRDTNSVQGKKKLNGLRSLGAATMAASRYYARGTANNMKKNIKNRLENAHPMRTAARFASGAVGGAALGAAGLTIGITSGDVSKAAQYAATGVMGGYKLTSGIPGKFDSVTPENVAEVADRARYDSDEKYKMAKQQKYIKEYQRNERNMFELERKYGKNESKRIMKEDIPTLLDNGVTDMKDIIAIEEMIKDEKVKVGNLDEGIAVKKYASRIGEDSTKMTEKKRREWHKTFSTEFSKKEKYSGYNHDNMASSVLDRVDAFNKAKNS